VNALERLLRGTIPAFRAFGLQAACFGRCSKCADRADAEKNILKPHRNQQWVIPPEANAGFVAAMEEALETYRRPRDADRPLVRLDKTSKQLIA
jgi:hypothetical protein